MHQTDTRSATGAAPDTGRRASVFERLASWSYRHRWWPLALWMVVLAIVTVAAQLVGSDYRNDFSLPGTESQRAADLLRDRAPARAGDSVQIVLRDTGGLTEAQTRARVTGMLEEVRRLPHVVTVVDPYAGPSSVSPDGTIGYATVTLDGTAQEVPPDAVRTVVDTARAIGTDGLQVELGGDAVRNAEAGGGGPAEGVGLLAALVVLVLLFGSLLAASLPIVVAIFAVGGTVGLLALASRAATVADFTVPLMMLVGLGVGIDYALLIFSRYRTELIAGADREQATRTALDTAGRTVVFAGCTVIIALLGLVALGLGSLQGVAVAIAVTVLVTMVAALTLLPALLAILGGRIERGVRRRAQRRGAATEGAGWQRWTVGVERHRWLALLLPVAALLALAAPALGMRLGFADAGNDPESSTNRRAYDLLAEGFGPGFSGPLIVVVQGGDAVSSDGPARPDGGPGAPEGGPAAQAAYRALVATPGVAAAVPPMASTSDLATVLVFPDTKPQDARTGELVNRLRDEVLPSVARDTGATFLVGGGIAATVDFADAVTARLPLFIAIVVGLSALLLLLVFRSLLIPVKAALLNLLSVGGAMGTITLVFQHGMFGVQPGPIEAFVPVMIFAIVFGLSMDYEVFLLARMHETWEQCRDASLAVREGLATTGRVVTAAAAIMVVVFGAFLLSPDRMLQQFGLGLAVAILLDAVVIRCLILPAAMRLLGARAWWLPARLDRRLPRLALEHS
ncbi:MMPL family transporter [Micromonospora polyrhachis]|uniref:RND superfamily putative drug exporter n=1 Tax=Micromonospora polyrhachis TaxID=1282883 RepID=A0A7W7SST8_9ACTN|nr:MMPL family transporter [Micromonospora polyrhachis]MBB4959906.1 RND superfamily putative drug exporter [Micromonospora polyrhachis]